jgi:hypothetical protein
MFGTYLWGGRTFQFLQGNIEPAQGAAVVITPLSVASGMLHTQSLCGCLSGPDRRRLKPCKASWTSMRSSRPTVAPQTMTGMLLTQGLCV